MKFKNGDRVKWHSNISNYDLGTILIVELFDNHGCWVNWDRGGMTEYCLNEQLLFLASFDYTDFLERIKDRMGIL